MKLPNKKEIQSLYHGQVIVDHNGDEPMSTFGDIFDSFCVPLWATGHLRTGGQITCVSPKSPTFHRVPRSPPTVSSCYARVHCVIL